MYTNREKYLSVRGVVSNPHGLQQQPYSWTSSTGMDKVIPTREKAREQLATPGEPCVPALLHWEEHPGTAASISA